MLTEIHELPTDLLELKATDLHKVLDGPSLIHIKGKKKAPLYVSVLIHGNEVTGFEAVQSLLKDFEGQKLPRSLSLFIANVAAAREGQRHLDHQPDYNRIWTHGHLPEHTLAREVMRAMRKQQPFASIDIHNNTGVNPHYSVLTDLCPQNLFLASLYSHNVLFFTRVMGSQMAAFAELCPSVAIECGKIGHNPRVTEEVKQYILKLMELDEIPTQTSDVSHVDLYHTLATIRVPRILDVSFGDSEGDICFVKDLDHFNFKSVPEETILAWRKEEHMKLEAIDDKDNDIGEQFFTYSQNEIRTSVPVFPAMLTLDKRIIRQDCLGYFMERLPASSVHKHALYQEEKLYS